MDGPKAYKVGACNGVQRAKRVFCSSFRKRLSPDSGPCPVHALALPDDVALRFAALDERGDAPLDVLTHAERAQLARFRVRDRQRAFALGRTAVRHLLAERIGCPPERAPLGLLDTGAPIVEGHPLYVSISHAGKGEETLAAAVLAPRPVGLDLERIVPRLPHLYRRILHPDEYDLLHTDGYDHDTAQVLLWSLKEAVLKGIGTGFQRAAQTVRLSEVGDGHAQADTGDGIWTLR